MGYSSEAALKVTASFSGPHFMALAVGALERPVKVTYSRAFAV